MTLESIEQDTPRDWFESVVDARDERIAELEAAIRSICYLRDGSVYNSYQGYARLEKIAPVLLEIMKTD